MSDDGPRRSDLSGNGSAGGTKRVRPRSAVHGGPTRKHVPPLRQRPRTGSPTSAVDARVTVIGAGEGPGGQGAPADRPAVRAPLFTAESIGPFRRPWREQVFTRVAVLDDLNAALPPAAPPAASADDVTRRLQCAWASARDRGGLRPGPNRARMERAFGNVDEAEAELLQRMPEPYLRGQLAGLVAHVRSHLTPGHPQRVAVEALAPERRNRSAVLTEEERALLVDATRTASAAARREHVRLRSFCTIVNATSLLLVVLAVVTAVVSVREPTWIPLCSRPGPTTVVCPTGSATGADATLAGTADGADVLVVMLVGLLAAAVTGAAAIRRIRGTSTPFGVPVALLLLKLPTGALTAVLGLILLNGQFVPGLTALDTSGQIVAWALLFGAAQQLVTGLVDKKAQSVLDATGTTPMTADKE